jgi:hypothetical protein
LTSAAIVDGSVRAPEPAVAVGIAVEHVGHAQHAAGAEPFQPTMLPSTPSALAPPGLVLAPVMVIGSLRLLPSGFVGRRRSGCPRARSLHRVGDRERVVGRLKRMFVIELLNRRS